MPEGRPIPVRLEEALLARLDRVAARLGTNRSALIRFLAKSFTEHFESRGGTASLPHNWEEILHEQDGRTYGQKKWHLRVAEEPPKKKRASG